MKKLLFVPLLLISVTMFAQTYQFGLKGGINVSNFTGSSLDNVDKKHWWDSRVAPSSVC